MTMVLTFCIQRGDLSPYQQPYAHMASPTVIGHSGSRILSDWNGRMMRSVTYHILEWRVYSVFEIRLGWGRQFFLGPWAPNMLTQLWVYSSRLCEHL